PSRWRPRIRVPFHRRVCAGGGALSLLAGLRNGRGGAGGGAVTSAIIERAEPVVDVAGGDAGAGDESDHDGGAVLWGPDADGDRGARLRKRFAAEEARSAGFDILAGPGAAGVHEESVLTWTSWGYRRSITTARRHWCGMGRLSRRRRRSASRARSTTRGFRGT